MNSGVAEKVIDIIKMNLIKGVEFGNIGTATDLINDLGFVSMSIIQLVVQIESEFNIELDVDDLDIEKLQNIGSLIDIVEKKLSV